MKWRVYAGDDPAFADPAFDDSHWALHDPNLSIDAVFPQKPSIVWYRLHVKVDPATPDLALDEVDISQAFEIYVNGERLMQLGQVSPFRAYTSGANVRIPIPYRMLASGAIIIAMRVHISNLE